MNKESGQDGLTKFIRFVYMNHRDITSFKRLQSSMETSFESNFKPESDQIDYMRK